jgi:hypothetical protein
MPLSCQGKALNCVVSVTRWQTSLHFDTISKDLLYVVEYIMFIFQSLILLSIHVLKGKAISVTGHEGP